MLSASQITLLFSGAFFLIGLLSGVWKFLVVANKGKTQNQNQSASSPDRYVHVLHRAALMYSFGSLVILHFVERSCLDENTVFWAAVIPQIFFLIAVGQYVKLALSKVPKSQYDHCDFFLYVGTAILAVAEIGGFGTLLWGVISCPSS